MPLQNAGKTLSHFRVSTLSRICEKQNTIELKTIKVLLNSHSTPMIFYKQNIQISDQMNLTEYVLIH